MTTPVGASYAMNLSRTIGLCFLMGSLPLYDKAQAQTHCAPTDAVMDISARQISAGVGYLWGHGTLSAGEHVYAFTVRGGGMPSIGSISLSGRGCVHNLGRVQDFNGTYWTLGGTLTVHHGTTGIVMENARGVDIDLHARTRGAQLSGQISRLSFHLVNRPSQPAAPTVDKIHLN